MLNKKQKRFCELYCDILSPKTLGNGTQSAILAGYSSKTSAEIASRLLKQVNIRAYIREVEEEQKAKHSMTKDQAIAEALKNYREVKEPSNKVKWFQIWAKLTGNDIERSENTQTMIGKIDTESLRQVIQQTIRQEEIKKIDSSKHTVYIDKI